MVEYYDPETDHKPRRRMDPAARAKKIAQRKEWAAGLTGEEAERKAKDAALRLLDRCDRSVGECRQKLTEKGFPSEAIEAALQRLISVNILNDLRYAQLLVRTRHAERGLVGSALRTELNRRHIPADIINQVMSELDSDISFDTANYLVEKKLRSMPNLPRNVKFRRLMGMLARKGYSSSLATQVINQHLNTDGTSDDYLQ